MLKRLPLAVLMIGATAYGQQVISAHSGVIHFVEGQVTLDGTPVQPKFAEFPDVKNGQTLAAQDGRAEVLLTPGVILRIGENSSFKMVSNSRSDTKLTVLTGSAIIEAGELLPTNAITISYGGAQMELVKKGLYRVDAEPGKLRVYDGEARVTEGSQTLVAHKGREVLLGTVLDMNGFDTKDTDSLLRWASRRSEYLAQANVSSARTASGLNSGYTGGGLGYGGLDYGGLGYGGMGYGAMGYGMGMGGLGYGSWAYNPWYGMFTYLPYGNGLYYSPFGYPYYSPGNIGYYSPVVYGNGGGGTGSAFPLARAGSSPRYNGSTGSYSMAPRGSYGSTGANSGSRGMGANTGFGGNRGGGLSGGGQSGGGGSTGGGGGISSGAASHGGGGGGGMGGGRGR